MMKKILFAGLLSVFVLTTGFVDMMSDCTSDGTTYYSIEDGLANPADVKKLDISMSKLSTISADIAKFENLECLDLSFNKFTTLPSEIASLKNLKYLNLAGTRFMAKVPDVVYEISSLEILDIQDHPEWKKETFDDAVAKLPKVKVITSADNTGEVKLD